MKIADLFEDDLDDMIGSGSFAHRLKPKLEAIIRGLVKPIMTVGTSLLKDHKFEIELGGKASLDDRDFASKAEINELEAKAKPEVDQISEAAPLYYGSYMIKTYKIWFPEGIQLTKEEVASMHQDLQDLVKTEVGL